MFCMICIGRSLVADPEIVKVSNVVLWFGRGEYPQYIVSTKCGECMAAFACLGCSATLELKILPRARSEASDVAPSRSPSCDLSFEM